MILPLKTHFGPYYVIDMIGAGAMGEVYRAHDPKLGRDVALKVMRAAISAMPEGPTSFEREARILASLKHPSIATVYGFHEVNGTSALAMELVDGETLASKLRSGRLRQSDALRYAIQIADALAYAHGRGLIHRDVKPSNIVITEEGAKLLDFGLAHLAVLAQTAIPGDPDPTLDAGTPFYMPPEQHLGRELDQRCDIYAMGLVLCQILTGFVPESLSGVSTRTLIRGLLNQIPSRPLRLVVERCVASDPEERWLHAADLRYALMAVAPEDIGDSQDSTDETTVPIAGLGHGSARLQRWRRWTVLATALVVVATVPAVFVTGMRRATVPPPQYEQLTFRRGTVIAARFVGDNSMVYSAAWDGGPLELWSTRPENPESRSLGIANARILSVSSSGEMAILIGRTIGAGGMLARLALDASAPREVLSSVTDADWAPNGQTLAVAHVVDGTYRLEYPMGNVLYASEGELAAVRVSPDGEQVAFVNHPLYYDDRGTVSVVARGGDVPRRLSGPWASVTGLAWSPDGREIWFTAAESGATASLYAVDLNGRLRSLARSSNRMIIHDVDRRGRVLLSEGKLRLRISTIDSKETDQRELSWLDGSMLADLSGDGRTLLINEVSSAVATSQYAVYLRKTDGSPAVRLGEGASPALSPDGLWAAALLLQSPPAALLLPTGAGMPRTLNQGRLIDYQAVAWFPDGKRILIAAREAGAQMRLWAQDVDGGTPVPVSPEGFRIAPFSHPISSDGSQAIVMDLRGAKWLLPLSSSAEPQAIAGLVAEDIPIRWDGEGRSVFVVRRDEIPVTVYRVRLTDGHRQPIAMLAPQDLAGVRNLSSVFTTADASSFAYSYGQYLSDLFLLTGLR